MVNAFCKGKPPLYRLAPEMMEKAWILFFFLSVVNVAQQRLPNHNY